MLLIFFRIDLSPCAHVSKPITLLRVLCLRMFFLKSLLVVCGCLWLAGCLWPYKKHKNHEERTGWAGLDCGWLCWLAVCLADWTDWTDWVGWAGRLGGVGRWLAGCVPAEPVGVV